MWFYLITTAISLAFFAGLSSNEYVSPWLLGIGGIIAFISAIVNFFTIVISDQTYKEFLEDTNTAKINYYINNKFIYQKSYKTFKEYLNTATNDYNAVNFEQNINKAISSAAKSFILNEEPIDWFYYLTVFEYEIKELPEQYKNRKISMYMFLASNGTFSPIPLFDNRYIIRYELNRYLKEYDFYKSNRTFFETLEKPYLTDRIDFDFEYQDYNFSVYNHLSIDADTLKQCHLPIFVKVNGTLEWQAKSDIFTLKECTFERANYYKYINSIDDHIYITGR